MPFYIGFYDSCQSSLSILSPLKVEVKNFYGNFGAASLLRQEVLPMDLRITVLSCLLTSLCDVFHFPCWCPIFGRYLRVPCFMNQNFRSISHRRNSIVVLANRNPRF